jgi:hypothetical protein
MFLPISACFENIMAGVDHVEVFLVWAGFTLSGGWPVLGRDTL